jgi:CRISPR-associated endoribonuclease Cas6
MRVKISFTRDNTSGNSIPLHHQKLIYDSLGTVISEVGGDRKQITFSSLKGTSKIQNGFMKFLSSKLTLVIASSDEALLEKIVNKIFEKSFFPIGRMNLLPKAKEIITDPEFTTQMRYLCISPLIIFDPNKNIERSTEQVDPTTHTFSDLLFNITLDAMEKSGIPEEKVNSYAEFDIQPDADYIQKINTGNKKYSRIYRNAEGKNMIGYLIPFTLHAHPDVHKFMWDNGIGVTTSEGYGMIDLAK